jgi:outer membrane protein assembly factor BamB
MRLDQEKSMRITDLIFVGIKGSVVALNRQTGEQIWATHLKSWDFVNIVVDDDSILASTWGEIFCLDALTGQTLWHNRLKGFGTGLTSIATAQHPAGGNAAALQARKRQEEETSASNSSHTVSQSSL